MFGFLKREQRDEELSREFVRHVFAAGRETCPSIADAIKTITEGEVSFPIDDDVSLEISLAILGTSLAVLKGHSKVMTEDRGTGIAGFCERSIQEDYDLSLDSAHKLVDALGDYQTAFEKAMAGDINPFGETSGIMLVRCLGHRAKALCLPGTSALDPLVHQIIGDVMTMVVTETLTFWKGK